MKDGHSAWDLDDPTAPQIIAHQDREVTGAAVVPGTWLAELKEAGEIELQS